MAVRFPVIVRRIHIGQLHAQRAAVLFPQRQPRVPLRRRQINGFAFILKPAEKQHIQQLVVVQPSIRREDEFAAIRAEKRVVVQIDRLQRLRHVLPPDDTALNQSFQPRTAFFIIPLACAHKGVAAHAVSFAQRVRVEDLAQLAIRIQNRQHFIVCQAVARQEQQHPLPVVFRRVERIHADADVLFRLQYARAVARPFPRRIGRHQLFHALALARRQAAVARQIRADIVIRHLPRVDLGIGLLQHPAGFLDDHAVHRQIAGLSARLHHRRILDNPFAHRQRAHRQTKQRHQRDQTHLFHAQTLPFSVLLPSFRCPFHAFMLPDFAFPCRHRDVSNL